MHLGPDSVRDGGVHELKGVARGAARLSRVLGRQQLRGGAGLTVTAALKRQTGRLHHAGPRCPSNYPGSVERERAL